MGHCNLRRIFSEAAAIVEHFSSIILKKMGNRREWEDWAQDVGEICSRQVEHIKAMVGDDATAENHKAFADFKTELAAATRVKLTIHSPKRTLLPVP